MSVPSLHRPAARRAGLALGLSLGLLSGLAPRAAAGEEPPIGGPTNDPFVYSLNEVGRVNLKSTPVETLQNAGNPFRFADLAVGDGDRWALRVDGEIYRNGVIIEKLPFPETFPGEPFEQEAAWIRLLRERVVEDRDGDGTEEESDVLTALSAGGLVVRDGELLAALPPFDLFVDEDGLVFEGPQALYVDLVDTPKGLFVLREDGVLFDADFGVAVGRFDAGLDSTGQLNGQTPATLWMRLVYDLESDALYALRADGALITVDACDLPVVEEDADEDPDQDPDDVLILDEGEELLLLGTDLGELVTRLPATPFDLLVRANLYVDLELDDNGNWSVMRRNGAIYTESSGVIPRVPQVGGAAFQGNPVETPLQGPDRTGNPFIDMVLTGESAWRVRSMGQFYNDDQHLGQLAHVDFVRMAVDDVEPDLVDVLNKRPTITNYKVRVTEGEAVVIPIIPVDLDQPVDEVLVEVDTSNLPGGTYDPATGLVTAPPGLEPGRYSVRVTLDDGGPQKTVRQKFKVRVLEARTKGARNRAPTPTKMGRTVALVDHELALPILATDRNGDPVVIEPVLDEGVFLLGATFDPATNTLLWTPSCLDINSQVARFRITDGDKTSNLRVRITVLFPLFFRPVVTPPIK